MKILESSLIGLIAAIFAAVIVLVSLYFGPSIGFPRLSGETTVASTTPKPIVEQQTELLFLDGLKDEPAVSDEWWAARSDHRLLAYAILSCKASKVGRSELTRSAFSALLLDLTPSGNHEFRIDNRDYEAFSDKPDSLILTPGDQILLALSDSIARARLAAAQGANTNVPWVERLGYATLTVSALATLFVTLQGRLKPVEPTDPKELEKGPVGRRIAYSLWGPGASFRWVAFFAIALSIMGTSMTAVKQVYDPTRTLTQNTRALLDLRQLHQEVVLGVKCDEASGGASLDKREQEWVNEIHRIRATIIPEYGAYANLDVGGSSQRPDPTQGGEPTPNPETTKEGNQGRQASQAPPPVQSMSTGR